MERPMALGGAKALGSEGVRESEGVRGSLVLAADVIVVLGDSLAFKHSVKVFGTAVNSNGILILGNRLRSVEV